MPTDTITLNVMTGDKQESWLKDLTHRVYSPRCDCPILLIRAGQVSEKARELDRGTQVQISSEATVSDVIAEARKCFVGYDEDFRVVEMKQGIPYGYPVEYRLYYPALSGRSLDDSVKVLDLGLVDGDLMIIDQRDARPPRTVAIMASAPSFEQFQDMVWEEQDPNDPMLLSTLLYTDADIDLAKYVREHFDELHQMSGPRVITYVVERPQGTALLRPHRSGKRS